MRTRRSHLQGLAALATALLVVATLQAGPASAGVTTNDVDVEQFESHDFALGPNGATTLAVQTRPDAETYQVSVIRCDDPTCARPGAPTVIDTIDRFVFELGVTVGSDDVPSTAYIYREPTQGGGGGVIIGGGGGGGGAPEAPPTQLRLTRPGSPPVVLETGVDVQAPVHLLTAGANPVLSYTAFGGASILMRCLDPGCLGGDEQRVQLPARPTDIALTPDGRPALVSGTQMIVCNDALCQGGDEVVQTLNNAAFRAIAIGRDGAPVGVGRGNGLSALLRCVDAVCGASTQTDFPSSNSVDNPSAGGDEVAVAITDTPLLIGGLFVTRCENTTCTGNEPTYSLDGRGDVNAGDVRAETTPGGTLVLGFETNDGPRIVTCDQDVCTGVAAEAPPPLSPEQEDAIQAALQLSRERFPDGGNAFRGIAVLATVEGFADSLAATQLLGDRPMLLTGGDRLHPDVAVELARLRDNHGTGFLNVVQVVGGPAAISYDVEGELIIAGYDVDRFAGASRIETSYQVASNMDSFPPTTFGIARAFGAAGNETSGWADSITWGAHAANRNLPTLLVPPDRGHPVIEPVLEGAFDVTAIGGPAAVPAGYDDAVERRVAGDDRFATARAIAAELWAQPEEGERTYLLINAEDPLGWAYGLPAAGLAADLDAPMLAVAEGRAPDATLEAVAGCDDQVTLIPVGDIDPDVLNQLDAQDADACPEA